VRVVSQSRPSTTPGARAQATRTARVASTRAVTARAGGARDTKTACARAVRFLFFLWKTGTSSAPPPTVRPHTPPHHLERAEGMAQPRMPTDKLSQAFGAASSALVAHTGAVGAMGMGGRPGAAQEVDLEDLFSLKRPKNVLSGASSGLQSIAKGADLAPFARCPKRSPCEYQP